MATILVRPSKIQANSSKHQAVNLTLKGAGWTSTTTFTVSGVAGVVKVAQVVSGTGSARIVVTTIGSAAGPSTLTVSDGGNTGRTTVKALSPSRGRWIARRRSRSRDDGPGAA